MKAKIVYLVIEMDWEETIIHGVFSTREKAFNHMRKGNVDWSIIEYEMDKVIDNA